MIYLFNNQEQLIKILSPVCLKSVEQTQALTDENYISDKLYIETRNLSDDLLAEVEYVAIQSVESKQKFDLYFLLRYRHDCELTILDCVQSGIEELMKTPVYDIRPQGVARDHANKILEGSQWSVQYVPETGRGQQNYYYIDAFTALKKMCSYFNIEMQFHVEITGNRIGARYIEFKKRIGQVTHKRVTYGHNALEIVKETQKDQIYTALIGRGRGEQVSSAGDTKADGKVLESDGYGRKINFEDVVWSKAKGDPVDKPKGQQYVEDVEATRKFGVITSKGVKPKIGFVEFDTEDREELLKRTYETLGEYARPRVELKTSAVYLDARIGDTVRVVRHDLGIDYPVRVFEVKWDRLTNSIVELRLGDILYESASKRQSRMMNAIKGEISSATGDMAGKLIDHVVSANGFTMNYYSKTEPENPKIGDSWFAPDPENEGHYILRMWNGESWEEIVRTKNWNVVNNKIKEAENRATVFRKEFEEKQQRNENELENFRESQTKKWEEIKVEIENKGNGLSTAINNVKSDVNSRITQLSSQIDLRVTRKDVEGIINNSGDAIYLAVKDKIKVPEPKKMTGQEIKNAIAIDQSGIQITGKHLGITADTYIEKGVIKESHIGTLSANKITTGVLNAADVKIINLDVKNISGLSSNFIQSMWNGINSQVYIDGNGITVAGGSITVHRDDGGIPTIFKGRNTAGVHLVPSSPPRRSSNAIISGHYCYFKGTSPNEVDFYMFQHFFNDIMFDFTLDNRWGGIFDAYVKIDGYVDGSKFQTTQAYRMDNGTNRRRFERMICRVGIPDGSQQRFFIKVWTSNGSEVGIHTYMVKHLDDAHNYERLRIE